MASLNHAHARHQIQTPMLSAAMKRWPMWIETCGSKLHEDNASALLLANSQHLKNRNKCLAVKLHHFWSHVKLGVIEVAFPKHVVREVFEGLRVLIMGSQLPLSLLQFAE
jgi:hypothetical protein